MSRNTELVDRVRLLIAINALISFGLVALFLFRTLSPHEHASNRLIQPNSVAFAEDGSRIGDPHQDVRDLSSHFKRSQPSKVQAQILDTPRGRIALVIDDLGFSDRSSTVLDMLAMPVQFTASIIPGQAASESIAERAHRLGHEVIAHVPMQPMEAPEHGSMLYLNGSMTEQEVDDFLQSVSTLPYANGLSNHQGSLATQDARLMAHVARWCSQRDWFVFDSITHSGTLLYQSARSRGVPAVRRSLFLDHHEDPDSIRVRLKDAVLMSERTDDVICVIAHPRSSTLEVLQRELPRLVEQGILFVRLSEGLEHRSTTLAVGDEG